MGKFLSAQQTAAALIRSKGSPVILRRRVTAGFDPVTQQEVAPEEVEATLQAVALAPSMAQRFGVNLEGRNAKELYFALQGATVFPKPGDTVMLEGEPWAIFWAQTYDPALDGPIMTVAYAERGAS